MEQFEQVTLDCTAGSGVDVVVDGDVVEEDV